MIVSILIRNYNYARYLGEAIDSALGQTYRDVEVIVVDDGSTDQSPDVIHSYGDRIVSRIKKNGGEASAMNACLEMSTGELICFLDSDDVFEPEKVERVVDAARRSPDAYLIHHQMQMMDAVGRPMYRPTPRWIPNGDIRQLVGRAGGWFPHAPTSGLTFRREYVEKLVPIQEWHQVGRGTENKPIRICPDDYFSGPAALLAPVAGIAAPLTRYRWHGRNNLLDFSSTDAVIRIETEMNTLACVLREKFGETIDLQLNGHIEYQLRRCAVRHASRTATAGRLLRSPMLPLTVRLRDAARVFANRGSAARA